MESRDIELPHRGFIFPDRNVAIATEGAEVIEGEFANYLLDGNTTDYTYEKGFSRHIIGTVINNMKCFLWIRWQDILSFSIVVFDNPEVWVNRCRWAESDFNQTFTTDNS